MTTVLSKEDIIRLLRQTPPLIEGLQSQEQQIQPNGVDLTVRDIALLASPGTIGQQNQTRVLSATSPLVFDGMGGTDLLAGCYLITYNEIVNLPKDIMALAFPRSSLLRCGVNVHTAVWDAGYSGRAQSLMVVYNPRGFRLFKNARVVQLVFFRLSSEVSEGYKGIFQKENM
ncbi:MAG: deoxyuridine 5'-triphosphate nucleotidohydrolase [Chloroflexi bacterium]|nr:deoxyuridine 5'-triphosphate nucleotidohydrolase [Chloroflexota bacterium]MBM3182830.1 deoxyuridine 5'-triphosphate nucleotidohydrolase [Chloroflexota bacterium]MBM4451056.1 deoxyuridine 5'-triphosphate nucleotidohydrolase [Chloroflexota bacterium]MBM4453946.1 deoxyuridine 5'-triphosphate nucleotidohydrolase [Chloroflexota bacterium]